HWPPLEAADRLLVYLLPATVVAEIVAVVVSQRRWLACFPRALVAVPAGWILLQGSVYLASSASFASSDTWSPREKWLYLGGMAAGLLFAWLSLGRLAARRPNRAIPLALAMTAGAAGITIMLSGYATGGQMGVPLSAAMAAAAIASFLIAGPIEWRGTVGVGVVMLFGLLVLGRFFGSLSTLHAVLLMVAPLLVWVGELPLVSKQRAWQRAAIRLFVVAILLSVVVFRARQKFAADSQQNSQQSGDASDPYASYK
ncbi:MAG TPA: hypothetical protein VKB78_04150, partial [Pirellulales bacterium]|nr:hypothetical protein [Pirellulales bacterium]